MIYYPKSSVNIYKTSNGGFIIDVHGTKECQEDGIGSTVVFESIPNMIKWLENHFENKGNE